MTLAYNDEDELVSRWHIKIRGVLTALLMAQDAVSKRITFVSLTPSEMVGEYDLLLSVLQKDRPVILKWMAQQTLLPPTQKH